MVATSVPIATMSVKNWCFITHFNPASYQPSRRSNIDSVQVKKRPCFSPFSGLSSRAHIIGVRVSETMAETTTEMVSTIANSRKSRPTMPVMKRSGMKTAMSETLSEMTVKPICRAPLSAASIGASPISMKRTMFSIITIASSTTKPVAMVNAMSERLSRVKPTSSITPKVPMIASGSETLGMIVAQNLRRKTKMTRTTRKMVRTSVNCTSWTEARMVAVRSDSTSTLTEGGSVEESFGSSAFTRSAVSMMFAPGCRWMSTMTAGLRPTAPASRTFSTLSMTLPRSRRRTGAPLR